jgi:hypothetical protein
LPARSVAANARRERSSIWLERWTH